MNWILWLLIALGAGCVFVPRVKYFIRTASTIIHELGHGAVILPFGGRISGIKLQKDTSGEAQVYLPRLWFPFNVLLRIFNLFAGYSAPVFVGFFLIVSVFKGWVPAISVLFILSSLILFLFSRNFFGLMVAVGYLGVNALFCFVIPQYLIFYAAVLAGALFLEGLREIFEVTIWVIHKETDNTDFHIAASEMFLPAWFWLILYWGVTVLTLILFARFLLSGAPEVIADSFSQTWRDLQNFF
jgi:hypothetical protein